MKALLGSCDSFISEMSLIYLQASQSRAYRVLHNHLHTVQVAVYAAVVALNLNVLLSPADRFTLASDADDALPGDDNSFFAQAWGEAAAAVGVGGGGGGGGGVGVRRDLLRSRAGGSSGDDGGSGGGYDDDALSSDSPPGVAAPALVLWRACGGGGGGGAPLSLVEAASLGVTCVLTFAVLGGLALVVAELAVTELPMVICEVDRQAGTRSVVAAAAVSSSGSRGSEGKAGGNGGGGPSGYALAACLGLGLSGLHALNFTPEPTLYACLLLGPCLPLAARFARRSVKAAPSPLPSLSTSSSSSPSSAPPPPPPPPRSSLGRSFAIVYDCLVTRSFLRHRALVGLCVLLGFFVSVEFFTLALLDVVVLSPVLR